MWPLIGHFTLFMQKNKELSLNTDNYPKGLSAISKDQIMQVEQEIETNKNVFQKFEINIPITLSVPQYEDLGSINIHAILLNESDSKESLEFSNSESSDSESDYNFYSNI